MLRASLSGLALLLLSSCSSRPATQVPDGAGPDGNQLPDSGSPELTLVDGTAPDLPAPVIDLARPDAPKPDLKKVDLPLPGASALQVVVSSITLPTSGGEYTHDYDGSGPKNKLGTLVQALKSAGLSGFDFQANLDQMISDGTFLLLGDLLAGSIVSDPAAQLKILLGRDLDVPANPADNFSGSESLGIDLTSPANLILPASINSGRLAAGPGYFLVALPMGTSPVLLSVKQALVQADLSALPLQAMTNGRIYGLIPWVEVQQKLMPAMAVVIDSTYKDPTTPASTIAILKTLFDLNGDGTITSAEVSQSAILKLVLAPDVDSDGDQVVDAMSIGMAFTAVKCTITP